MRSAKDAVLQAQRVTCITCQRTAATIHPAVAADASTSSQSGPLPPAATASAQPRAAVIAQRLTVSADRSSVDRTATPSSASRSIVAAELVVAAEPAVLRAPDISSSSPKVSDSPPRPPSLLNPVHNDRYTWVSGIPDEPLLRDGVLICEGAIIQKEWWSLLVTTLGRRNKYWGGDGTRHLISTQWLDERRVASLSVWASTDTGRLFVGKLQQNVSMALSFIGIYGAHHLQLILTRALEEGAEGEDQLYHVDSTNPSIVSIVVTGEVKRYIKFAHRQDPTCIPPWSICAFGSVLCHHGIRSLKDALTLFSMPIFGGGFAHVTNAAAHFYGGVGYTTDKQAVTEPCVTHGVDTLYNNDIILGKRGEQRVFSGPEGVCQGTSADHARRVEKAVQTADGQVNLVACKSTAHDCFRSHCFCVLPPLASGKDGGTHSFY